MAINPIMMTLKADPARYIDKSSTGLLLAAKTGESAVALSLFFRTVHFLESLLKGTFCAEALGQLLGGRLPRDLIQLDGRPGAIVCEVLAALLLLAFACTIAETALLWVLRLAHRGASLLKQLHRAVWLDAAALLAAVLAAWALQLFSLGSTGKLSAEQGQSFSLSIAAAAISLLLLGLRVVYHRGAASALKSVEYELKLGFKDMDAAAGRLAATGLVFELLFLAGAAALLYLEGYRSREAWVMALMALKFFAVRRCWGNFRFCHR